jgi:hypothetical protein
VSAKRGDKAQRPTASGEWKIRFGNKNAAKAWAELSNGKIANALAKLYDIVVKDPRWSGNPDRHHQLRGTLATGTHAGRTMERWQHEVTGGGRVWFLIDDDERTVWLVHVGEGHPAATD